MSTTAPGDAGTGRLALSRPDVEYRLLMAGYQAGEAAAFEALYARLGSDLEACLGGAAPKGRCRQLVDEVFLTIHEARASYDPRWAFQPWVSAITDHVVRRTAKRIGRN